MAIVLTLLAGACAEERDRGGVPPDGVHAGGLLDPASPGFHGALVRAAGWDLALCAGCHGDDFDGGASGASCRGCHAGGPTACDTCHDEAGPRATGAHAAHTTAAVPCGECHDVPARWDADGHVRRGGAPDDGVAEVRLGALAARDVEPPRRTEPPRYDAATRTCAAVYCHGGTLGDAAAVAPAPRWDEPGAAACGGCHGAPPADHASDACATCHRGAAHLDGVLDVGAPGAGCSGCHGDAASPAPPRGLGGETSPQVLAVGVHRAHLSSSSLRGPIACATCHAVPATRDAPGHLDSALPAEVLPAIGWDRATATCAGSCHGDARPVWNHAGDGEATCGTCHGLPPAGGSHTPAMTIASCTSCHPSVDAIGAIVFTAGTSAHLDGDVDVR